jgi:phosphoglycolate phosphatase
VLWDIDGTLVTSAGSVARAFLDAVEQVTSRRPSPRGLDLGGRIDPEIASLLLYSVGLDDTLVATVLACFKELVRARTDGLLEQINALEGVVEVLTEVAAAGVRQSVLTGNLETVGRMKLFAAGLIPPIDADFGGFGDDCRTRPEVGRRALDKLTASGWEGSARDCWIVGDTPRDLACAKSLGLRCALVASGRFPVESLAALGADIVIPSLVDPSVLLSAWQLSPR